MQIDPLFLVIFVLASIGGSALLVLALRAGGNRRERLRQFAEEHGWHYEYVPASGGGASETRISDPGEGWTLVIHFFSSSSSGGSVNRWSEYRDPTLALSAGMAVLGPDIPENTKEMADKMLGMMGGDIGRYLLDKLTGGLGEEAQALRTVDSVGPGTLIASPGAETALEDLRFAPELANARAGKNEAQQPIVMRGPFGLKVRLPHLLRKPDEIEDFVRLCRALSDNLKAA